MFGPLGLPELILIFVVALLLFGPRKMPEIGKSIGRALGEFRRASNDFKRSLEDEVSSEELRNLRRDLQAPPRDSPIPQPVESPIPQPAESPSPEPAESSPAIEPEREEPA